MKERKPVEAVVCEHWRYEYYAPCEKLKDIVACYVRIISRGKNADFRKTRFIPDGKMDLLFDLQAEETPRRASLKGLTHNSCFIRRKGKTEILTIKLQPGAFYSLFHLPAHRFTGTVTPLRSAIGLKAALFDDVFLRESIQIRIRTLEAALEKLVGAARPPDPRIKLAVDIINNAKDTDIKIGGLARMLKISENQLMVKFKKWVGTSPKRFCRIVRFARARHNIWARPQTCLLELALDAGYYDQAHFSHEFKKFYGMVPSQLQLRELHYFLKHNKPV